MINNFKNSLWFSGYLALSKFLASSKYVSIREKAVTSLGKRRFWLVIWSFKNEGHRGRILQSGFPAPTDPLTLCPGCSALEPSGQPDSKAWTWMWTLFSIPQVCWHQWMHGSLPSHTSECSGFLRFSSWDMEWGRARVYWSSWKLEGRCLMECDESWLQLDPIFDVVKSPWHASCRYLCPCSFVHKMWNG